MPKNILITWNGHEITAESQYLCLHILKERGYQGATSQEIENQTGKSHGTISGALSTLHEEGLVELLTEKRGKYKVYVLPENVGDRDRTSRHPLSPNLTSGEKKLLQAIRVWWDEFPDDLQQKIINELGVTDRT